MFAALLTAAACGGGGGDGATGGGASPPPIATPPPVPPASGQAPLATGSVIVRATTSSGVPVAGASIAINGGFDGRGATSDANGEVRFEDIPAGDASTNIFVPGYHGAAKRFVATGEPVTRVTVFLEHASEATPVVLAMRPVASNDGRTLTLDVDIAVLDPDGVVRETLTASDFDFYGTCGWDPCIVRDDLTDTNLGYVAQTEDAQLIPAPVRARPALTLALLLDESSGMATFDPVGARLVSVHDFLASVTPPDTVAIGSYRGVPGTPTLTTYGDFTSDTTVFRDAIKALAGKERGLNAFHAATSEMISFMTANVPAASGDRQRAIVVLTPGQVDGECANAAACKAAVNSIVAGGIPVFAIGSYDFSASMAAATGGAAVYADDPTQFAPVLRRIGDIVGRTLPHHRVRLLLESENGAFQRGRSVAGYLSVRVGPDTVLSWWVVVPI